jgi:predicted Zn-dependent protease
MRIPAQEKIQLTVPIKDEAGEGWVSFAEARQSQACVPSFCGVDNNARDVSKFNNMPPGMDIDNQNALDLHQMPLSMAGETDVSADTNDKSFAKGFTRRDMRGIDDQYTDEHVDLFYGEVVDENGKCSFLERNNYLDRL